MGIWKLKITYPRGYKVYEFKKDIKKHPNEYRFEGNLTIGNRGRNTAYIIFRKICTNYSNTEFGFELAKHFQGHNASHSARAWFRYLFLNSPDYCNKISKRVEMK